MEATPGTSTDSFFDFSDEEVEDVVEDYVPLSRRERNEDPDTDCDSSDDEIDFVDIHNSSIDSDEPLSVYAARVHERNSPGTCSCTVVVLCPMSRYRAFLISRVANSYADSHPNMVKGHERRWMPLTVPELQIWIALRIMMGISPKPRQAQYWSKDDLHESPFFPKHMPRDRFDQISTSLHFADNAFQDGTNRLWKLGRIVQLLQKNCLEAYTPPQCITVDESLWKFRGRLSFVTYNPSKRARFGLKIYKLSVSSGPTCGYTCSFRFYTGQDRGNMPASHKAVSDLMEAADVLDKGYTLYVDNWYTSPTLFHWLQGRKTNACGTVRPNRKWMPKDFTKLKLNEVDHRSTPTGMLCLKWVDKKKTLHVLSTMHNSEMVQIDRLNRQGQNVIKPRAIIDYNEGMKGVDVGDQLAASYPAARRSLKWYKKVFFYLFDLAMTNAFALYREVGSQNLQQLAFREEVVRGLLREYLPEAPNIGVRITDQNGYPVFEDNHTLTLILHIRPR
ncbi:piggyBac transposable element-derived protein 4-like [Penaeus japonicus]|uniref:piggyBac transposable element-derived protein 4-like n=1 Tax=Penaeus japonicus TaxID=27405 RepID=UPI001C70FF3D|nr:piggyBac transposable element-derived protein 4-like [Penaeus japonicus]